MTRVRVDSAVALALTALWQLEVWLPAAVPGVGASQHRGALAVAGLVQFLPLAIRRTSPLMSCALVMGGSVLVDAVGPSPAGLSVVAALLLSAFSVAAYAPRRPALAGLGLAFAAVPAADPSLDDAAFGWLLLGGAWAGGRALRAGRARADALEALTAELGREREERARMAVTLERTRIARELHDVIGHAVSVMVMQAGGVRGLLAPEQADEREALLVVERTGRQAMDELRRTVEVLRDDGGADGGALAPPPRLGEVESLVDELRGAGVPVTLTRTGDVRPLPPGLELSAYRVVQEALTNTLRHAGPARAEVRVDYGPRCLEVEVCDDGAGPPAANGHRGHGLLGMAERVALFDGDLETGPVAGGGYRVRARFPVGSPG